MIFFWSWGFITAKEKQIIQIELGFYPPIKGREVNNNDGRKEERKEGNVFSDRPKDILKIQLSYMITLWYLVFLFKVYF